ncbi:DUF4974 domain-containing protein [Gramella sp. BOM4]|nr:DUF4974 domain-containing protein [Christiangramia bathymodioli]
MKKESTNTAITNKEIQDLRKEILLSVEKEKRSKKQMKLIFAAAATFALLFGVGYFSQIQSEPSLEDFVRTAPKIDIEEAEGITLLLGDDTRIDLNEENSAIQYSSSGQSINIGSGKKVTQHTKIKNKPVFNTVIVPYGKRTTLELSDGTLVWLNSGSKLIYPASFTGVSRPVYLEGEAIFDVAHNAKKPFKVNSEYQEIEVLGTIFNITSYPGDQYIETVLKEGSVNITYQNSGNKKVKLIPGNLSSFNVKNSEIKTANVEISNYFSWRSGFLRLENNTLSEIMKKLSRYYNFTFTIHDEDLGNQTLSGKLDLKEDFEQVLEVLRQTTEFNFRIKNNNLVIQ